MNNTLIQTAHPKTGVVYTQKSIAHGMVREAIISRLSTENPDSSIQFFDDYFEGRLMKAVGQKLNHTLRSFSYLDPSTGEGVFLIELINIMETLHTHYGETLSHNWIESHITGFDIDKEAIKSLSTQSSPPNIEIKDYLLFSASADIIVGNPPYVRQELLNHQYKNQIHELVQKLHIDLAISKRSDLYVYFILKTLNDLNDKGICTLIIPNTWLDSDYGKCVREILTNQFEIVSISDSHTKHFNVDINTVILTVRKQQARNTIQIKNEQSVKSISYLQLPKPELSWSGSLFRTPGWLLDILSNNQHLTSLENQFSISTGIITGNNKKYYSDSPINGSYEPGIKSPRDSASIIFHKKDTISWIKNQKISYKLKRAPILWPDLRGYRHMVVWNKDNLPFEHTFYGLTPSAMDVQSAVCILNSSWMWLMVELFGRRSLGGGAIRLVKSGLQHLPVPKLTNIDVPNSFFERPIEHWKTELSKEDRNIIDRQILSSMGLEDTYNNMMDLLRDLMTKRSEKAKS